MTSKNLYCKLEQRNLTNFYCEVVCENRINAHCCPFARRQLVQLDLSGQVIDTPADVVYRERRQHLQRPTFYRPPKGR